MIRMPKTIRVFAFLAIILIMVGCSGPTAVVPPTPDIPSIRTESVQTVVSKLTIEAVLNPSPTAESTQTPVPAVATATEEPTATQAPAAAPTETSTPITPTRRPSTSGGSGAVYPTATRRAGPDQANLISQSPTDGTVINPGSEFDGTWTFKNIGTSTWTTGFEYRFAGGTNLAKDDRYSFPQSVAPNESVTLVADMVAPSSNGRYVSNWELINENGDVFYTFYLVIDIK